MHHYLKIENLIKISPPEEKKNAKEKPGIFHKLLIPLFFKIQRKSSTYSVSLQVMNCGSVGSAERDLRCKEIWQSSKEPSWTSLCHPRPTLSLSANAAGSALQKKP